MERKVVLVTGGSRGIGKAIAIDFANKGYDVVINYKRADEEAKKLKEELETLYSIKALIVKADVSNEDEVQSMIKLIIKEFRKIDVLVNNAGIAIDKEFDERTVEDWQLTLNTNLIAPFIVSKYVGSEMLKNKSGKIINISSTNGIDAFFPTSIDYDASKAGLISLTHNLAIEFAPYATVNAIAPGLINTESEVADYDDEFMQMELDKILVRRIGEASEVAHLVKFLISDEASYINNSIIRIDGGQYSSN